MTHDIHNAFAHPLARAKATAHDKMLDRISLRDHTVDVEIGAFQAERGTSQRISFNIVVEVKDQTTDIDDDVDQILSYDTLTQAIAYELSVERLNLLETLAERVADRILAEPQAMRVFVRIEKMDRGPGALGVEIVRSHRDENTNGPAAETPVRPRVVFLGNAVLSSSKLTGWIDALQNQPVPLILCVGPGKDPIRQVENGAAQRRIDLLAVEQNAWVLAASDKRCVVVATRTEMDWAMKHGQICVWAPSKITLDAVEGAEHASATEGIALAKWFSQELEAQDFLVIGASDPDDACGTTRCFATDQLMAYQQAHETDLKTPKG